MKIIGITGSFKTGKTTALNILKNLGAEIIDADKIAHELLKTKDVIKKIETHFKGSPDIVENNVINRDKLAQVVFGNRDELRWLNDLIHPLVARNIKNSLQDIKKRNPDALVAIEIPLLYEADMVYLVDKVIVVSADRNVQIARALQDGYLREDTLKRIESQLELSKKEECGDFVIDNNSSLGNVRSQVKEILKKINEE
ncbi:MAG: dephospho-CoA kinase [Candidatus Kappaea frigidicola]|nr:dephospho-CoA kinase [Candidatus Kappaea frigidicola]